MDVKHISTEDFFLSFNAYLACLGFKRKHRDVHFTLSFNPKSDDINFHVTRNTADKDDKPKIVIAVANKKALEIEMLKFSTKLFRLIYQPLIIPKVKLPKRGYHPQLQYLPLSSLEEGKQGDNLKTAIHTLFRQSSALERKGRIRIYPDIGRKFTQWARTSCMPNLIKARFMPLPYQHTGPEVGYLSTSDYSGAVILLEGRFYRQRDDLTLWKLANKLWGAEKTKTLIALTHKAVKHVLETNSYQESKAFNDPIRLF